MPVNYHAQFPLIWRTLTTVRREQESEHTPCATWLLAMMLRYCWMLISMCGRHTDHTSNWIPIRGTALSRSA
jgi:hypothetical protein